tara:strand:- start:394 stop:903 length:510 start_codon:yes stop_codon:yes gene_type:complete
MEKRLNKKIDIYIKDFKDAIKDKSVQMNMKNEQLDCLIQFIYDYDKLTLNADDLKKRKRIKNFVPVFDRCCAKRATGEQCTRRKKTDFEYCGTHIKGTPHGTVDADLSGHIQTEKIEVWAQDISGIIYYIDNRHNVYQTEDIASNKTNPKVVAKYQQCGDTYSIPEFYI